MYYRDKYGWPVETIKGRPIVNFIRRLIHTNIRTTWHYRKKKCADIREACNCDCHKDYAPGTKITCTCSCKDVLYSDQPQEKTNV